MAPLRAQIMHMTKTLHTTDRELHYFYGARALNEVFYLQDFQQLEKDFPNFHFHLALDRPDPVGDNNIKSFPFFQASMDASCIGFSRSIFKLASMFSIIFIFVLYKSKEKAR